MRKKQACVRMMTSKIESKEQSSRQGTNSACEETESEIESQEDSGHAKTKGQADITCHSERMGSSDSKIMDLDDEQFDGVTRVVYLDIYFSVSLYIILYR